MSGMVCGGYTSRALVLAASVSLVLFHAVSAGAGKPRCLPTLMSGPWAGMVA